MPPSARTSLGWWVSIAAQRLRGSRRVVPSSGRWEGWEIVGSGVGSQNEAPGGFRINVY